MQRFTLYRLADPEPRKPMFSAKTIEACTDAAQADAEAGANLPKQHRKLKWYTEDSGATWPARVYGEIAPRYVIEDEVYRSPQPKA